MCIIIVKPQGEKIPEKVIEKQWKTNPDGAGFAVRIENKRYPLYFKKGIMSLEQLLEDKEFQEYNSEDYELVLHLRKSTGGGVRPELCHPFPILSRNRLQGFSKALLFHNGTFNLRVPKKYEHLSDTAFLAYFARRIGLKNFKMMLRYDILNRNKSRVLLWTDAGMLFKGKWHTYKGLKVSKPLYDFNYRSYSSSYNSSYYRDYYNKSLFQDEYFGFDDTGEELNSPVEILPSEEGRKVIKISDRLGEKLAVLAKLNDGQFLLEDGSLWEPPDSVADSIEVGDLIEF